jgi:hypothetical protein
LPEKSGKYIIHSEAFGKANPVFEDSFNAEDRDWYYTPNKSVTHWQTFPEAPS